MKVKFSKFDPVNYLDSSARIDDYLIVAEKEKDPILLENVRETDERARKQLPAKERKSLETKFARTSTCTA